MRIPCIKKKQPDTSWPWAIIRFMFLCLAGKVFINVCASFLIFLVYCTSEPYMTLDPLDFQLWKAPAETLLTWQISLLLWYHMFKSTFDISFLSEQDQVSRRNHAEHTAEQQAGRDRITHTEHVVAQERGGDRPIASSATSPTRSPFIEPLDFGEREFLIEAGRHSVSSPSSPPIDGMIQHGQSLRHTIRFGQGRDERQLYKDKTASVHADDPPNSDDPVDSEDNTASMHADDPPNSDHPVDSEDKTASVHADHPPTSDHPAVCGKETSSSRTPLPLRLTFKQRLLQEALQEWNTYENVDQLKKLMHYDDDNDDSYLPEPKELTAERRRYESYAHNNTLRSKRPIHVYGTNDLYAHDRLRLWVKLRLNINPETPFPPDYEAMSDNVDEVSISGTLYSQELSTAGSRGGSDVGVEDVAE